MRLKSSAMDGECSSLVRSQLWVAGARLSRSFKRRSRDGGGNQSEIVPTPYDSYCRGTPAESRLDATLCVLLLPHVIFF